MRVIAFSLPDPEQLGIPDIIQVPINDSKSLSVEISLTFSGEGRFTGEWKRLRWQTLVEAESESQEGTLNLLR